MCNNTKEDYKKYVDYYTGLMKASSDINIVGSWGGVDQSARYEKLIDYELFRKSSILEIGCGLGGFLDYMITKGIVEEGQYCGCDILEDMRKQNIKHFPGYKFLTRNIMEEPLNERYDIVVMCGVFHLKTKNGGDYMKELLRQAYNGCNKLLSFNFISSYVNYLDDDIEYHDPTKVLKFCLDELSTKVVMEHHYWKCDVSCKVYR